MAHEPLLRRLLGAVLRERREAQGRTLRSVAEQARVSVAYLSEIERGRKEASSEVLVAVCGALGMGLVDLLADARGALTGPAQVIDLASRAPSVVGAGRPGAIGHALSTRQELPTAGPTSGPAVLLHAA